MFSINGDNNVFSAMRVLDIPNLPKFKTRDFCLFIIVPYIPLPKGTTVDLYLLLYAACTVQMFK